MSQLFSRFILHFTFIKNIYISIDFFFIMKILTDFRKTVETGMDPRLYLLQFFFFTSYLTLLHNAGAHFCIILNDLMIHITYISTKKK